LTVRDTAVWLPILGVLVGFVGFCEVELVRRPARYLPKLVWALIIVAQIPLGGIAYLVFGRGELARDGRRDKPARDEGRDERRDEAARADRADAEPPPSTVPTADPSRDPVVIRPRDAAPPTTAIRTHALTKVFDSGAGLHAVDLAVPARGVYGLVGPNGAGKTTLLALLAGLRRADSGQIESQSRILLCPDTPAFEPWLTAAETVAAFTGHQPASGVVADALARVGLADVRDRRVGRFSRGMTQRLGLALVLASRADVLLLDEPTSALDPQGRSDMLDLMVALANDRAVIVSSHILADVQRIADTVGVLRDGRLLYQGSVSDLLDQHTRPSWQLHLRSGAPALAARLAGQPWVAGVSQTVGGLRVDTTSVHAGETQLPVEIAASGAELIALNPVGADLESVFLNLVEAGS